MQALAVQVGSLKGEFKHLATKADLEKGLSASAEKQAAKTDAVKDELSDKIDTLGGCNRGATEAGTGAGTRAGAGRQGAAARRFWGALEGSVWGLVGVLSELDWESGKGPV